MNKDLDNLAQKSEENEYKISAESNFHIPDKRSENSNLIIIEHIDEMLEILREQPTAEDNEEESEIIHDPLKKTDNIGAIMWPLY
ncbi:MAG: hypothetical protein ACKO96_10075, partial [Flammeovirgaceae bacterium]